jgi:hypothetical protein
VVLIGVDGSVMRWRAFVFNVEKHWMVVVIAAYGSA